VTKMPPPANYFAAWQCQKKRTPFNCLRLYNMQLCLLLLYLEHFGLSRLCG
jgi:hypothetical protein